MKWYKHDPAAFLEGVIGMDAEERGFYITVIDLLYARDGKGVTDALVCSALACRPQVWRRVKSRLTELGKIRETDGKLTANRVETTLQTDLKLREKMVVLRGLQLEKQQLNNGGAARTPRPTPTPKEDKERKDASRPKERKGASRPSRAKVPLDEAWIPEGLPQQDVAEFDRFRDHARKNDSRYANWEAAWRNWKTSPYRKANGNGRSGSILEAADRLIDRLGGEEAARNYVPRSWGPGNPEFDAERERETQQKHLDFRKGANGLRLISKG